MAWVDYLLTFLLFVSLCLFFVGIYRTACALTQLIYQDEKEKGYIKTACGCFLLSLMGLLLCINF